MPNKRNEHFKITWTDLGNKISISNFPSVEGKNEQVYLKKFDAINTDSTNKMTFFLLHDIGQYHGRFTAFVNWMRENTAGISFVAMDFIGHGLSSGTRGHFKSSDTLVKDFLFLLNHTIKNHEENEKWIVIGHGMGGVIALDLMVRSRLLPDKSVDGLIISNFILNFPNSLVYLKNNFKKKYLKNFLEHLRIYKMFKGKEILSTNEDILIYDQDSLIVERPTFNAITEIQNRMHNIYQDSYFLERPLLFLTTKDERLINEEAINYFMRGVKKDLLHEKKYSHIKYDLYNERDKVEVFKDILDWIKIYEN